MSQIELNAILFYADYLSLQAISIPVTDNCKYFYIHGVPINSAYILGMTPEYDEESPYFKQSLTEYQIIKERFGEDGVNSFVEDICAINACGSVDAERMLNKIHQYTGKHEKRRAFQVYNKWKQDQIYSHITINENGDPQEKECTKYVYHAERMLGRPGLVRSIRKD